MREKLLRAVLSAALLLLAQSAFDQQLPLEMRVQNAAVEPLQKTDGPHSGCRSNVGTENGLESENKANEDLAICALETNQFDSALAYLNPMLRKSKDSSDTAYLYYLRAKADTGKNDVHKAQTDLGKAVSLQPEFAAAWSDLGIARKTLLDRPGAFEAFQRAVACDPNDGVAQYRLGLEYLSRGDFHLAVDHLEAAQRIDPQDQSTLNSLQLALRRDGQTARAEEITKTLNGMLRRQDDLYQKALRAVAINNEGARLEKGGDLHGAAEKYREALEVDSGQVRIRVNLAIALLRLGNWSEGLSDLRTAIHADPENGLLRRAWSDATKQAPPGTLIDGVPLSSLQAP